MIVGLEPSTPTAPEGNATYVNFTKTNDTQSLSGANRDVMPKMDFLIALISRWSGDVISRLKQPISAGQKIVLFPHPSRSVPTLVDSRAIKAKDGFEVLFAKENPQIPPQIDPKTL